jgi:hypothetical protein
VAAKGVYVGHERGGRRQRPTESGCRGVPMNFAGKRQSQSRGAVWGGDLREKMAAQVAGEEAGRLHVRAVKNRKNFEIQCRIFHTTQNRKISKKELARGL